MKWKLVNKEITQDYGIELLKERGIENIDQFLNPTIEMVQDPLHLENIQEGADLLIETLNLKARILLLPDSDADGMTSAAILYGYIKDVIDENAEIDYWLHEAKQHGLEDHIDRIEDLGDSYYDLVITPDAGSNDYEYHERLANIGTKVLVLDHHEAEGPFSENAIIINNQLSENYKNKNLAGAGVVHQFCRFLDSYLRATGKVKIGEAPSDKYWDLAAVGIIGDMMPVDEPENRYYISRGLCYPTENFFLNSIYEAQYYSITKHNRQKWEPYDIELLNENLKPMTISFYISPLINAMIRYGEVDEKTRMFEAMIEGDKIVASTKRGKEKGNPIPLAEESIRLCMNARNRQNKAKEKASEKLEIKIHKEGLLENKILFVELDKDDVFPPELNGLIAMQLTAKHQRPTILARRGHDGFIKGSMRGINGSELDDLRSFLMDSTYFEWVQGHANAAGVCIDANKVDRFHLYANEELKDIDFGQGVYDVNFVREAVSEDISLLVKDLSYYEKLWGQNIPEPMVLIKNLPLSKVKIQIIGARQDTLKFYYNDITYIKFRATKEIEALEAAQRNGSDLTIVGRPNLNEYNGMINAQIMISDFEVIENNKFAF